MKQMTLFQTLIATNLPRFLYHYTSQRVLLEIVRNKEVWATNIHFFNDSAEFKHALGVANVIFSKKLQADPSEHERHFLQRLPSRLEQSSRVHIFAFCMSANGDQLSQWRGYCPNGSGYSIGFEPSELKRIAERQGFLLAPCVYDFHVQEELVLEALEPILDEYRSAVASSPANERNIIENFANQFVSLFIPRAAMIKNASFREEAEWRLISPITPCNHPQVGVRQGISTLVPYYRLSLSNDAGQLPQVDVITGPAPDQQLAIDGLGFLFCREGITNCTSRVSQIPYRNW
jgi:hypothetical protein